MYGTSAARFDETRSPGGGFLLLFYVVLGQHYGILPDTSNCRC